MQKKTWLQRELIRRAAKEKAKTGNLLEDGSGVIFWVCIVGSGAVAIVGGIFDAAIIYGMFYQAIKMHYVSLFAAGLISSVIQLTLGVTVFKFVKILHNRSFEDNGGYNIIMWFCAIWSIVCLLGTLFFSWNTKYLIETLAEPNYKESIISESPTKGEYEAKFNLLLATYEKDKAELRESVRKLRADKVKDNGKWVTRWANLAPINKIESKEIPALKRQYDLDKQALKDAEKAEISHIRSENSKAEKVFIGKVSLGGSTTRWINIIMNLCRCLIVAFMAILFNNIEAPTPIHTQPKKRKPNPEKKKPENPEKPNPENFQKRKLATMKVLNKPEYSENSKTVKIQGFEKPLSESEVKAKIQQYEWKLKNGKGKAETNNLNIQKLKEGLVYFSSNVNARVG